MSGLVTIALISAPSIAQAATPTPAPPPTTCELGPHWLSAENALKQGRSTSLFKTTPSAGALQIYTKQTEVHCGNAIEVVAASKLSPYRIELWRTGWYGGAGARRVFVSPIKPRTADRIVPGQSQELADSVDFGFVTASGGVQLDIPVTNAMKPGIYFARVITAKGISADAPFVVSSPRRSASTLFVASMMTAYDYNAWGGSNGYHVNYRPAWLKPKEKMPKLWSTRTSVQKPWQQFHAIGDGGDASLASWIERSGANLDYTADVAITETSDLSAYRTLVFGQHPEYETYNGLNRIMEAARHGTNLAIFGSNAFYWNADTTVTDGALQSLEVDRTNGASWFKNFDLATHNTIGTGIACGSTYGSKLHIAKVDNPLFRGVPPALVTKPIPGIFEQEVDNSTTSTLANTEVLAESPDIQCKDATPNLVGKGQMVESRLESGARIFDAGGFGMTCAALNFVQCPKKYKATPATTSFARIVISNVIAEYSK